MKKILIVVLSLFFCSSLFADTKTAKEYIADLNPQKDEKIIITAAEWLGNEKEKDAIPGLIKLLSDARENVRVSSAVALGYIGEEEACDALNASLLKDESANVRYAAILSTFRIGSKKSLKAWQEAKEKESDPVIRDFLTKMEEKARGK